LNPINQLDNTGWCG